MSDTLTIPVSSGTMPAQLARPTTAPAALIILAYGSDGPFDNATGPWKTMIDGFVADLTRAGFAVVMPDYLSATRTAPGSAALELIARHRDAWEAAILATIATSAAAPGLAGLPAGLLGFSLGAHLCLRVRKAASVLVAFYAPVLDGIGAAGTLSHAQIHHGTADQVPGTGYSNAGIIAAQLSGEGTLVDLNTYPGAGHGFVGTDPANTAARKQSQHRTVAFFTAHIGRPADGMEVR
ncbi:MAG: dienelactone hydrolase family protein [Rhodospirillales bacterium]|nr:dienelactone hydrolase family protein [Rhodospirillales bacterium]